MLKAYSICYIGLKKYEADDIIGSIVEKYKNLETVILSSDRDLYQLIGKNVKVYTIKKGLSDIVVMDEEELKKTMNLRPDQIVDYKSLAGDKSDSIKGVSGIGPKTAVELLNTYGSAQEIYNNIDSLKKSIQTKLEVGKEDFELSKKLATIRTDVKINAMLDEMRLKFNSKNINAFYEKFGIADVVWNKDFMDDYLENDDDWTGW